MGNRGKESELHPAHPRLRAGLTVLSILLISLAHYSTDTQLHLYHDVYRRLYYLPIFMGALWFGLKGGLGASLLCSVLYAPHVLFQWKDLPSLELEKYLEILLFNIVGAVTGLLAEWLNRQRNLYRKTSEELEKAYEELEDRSSRLSLAEKQLRSAEKVSALGEMSATVAHEFMNPLGSIKGAVEILKEPLDTYQDTTIEYSPQDGDGYGLVEAPRGPLIHHYYIEKGLIAQAEFIIPTVHNVLAIERALRFAAERYITPKQVYLELEHAVGRVVRAFDPCIACATH